MAVTQSHELTASDQISPGSHAEWQSIHVMVPSGTQLVRNVRSGSVNGAAAMCSSLRGI